VSVTATETLPVGVWTKSAGGFELRLATSYGRVWPTGVGDRWAAVRRPDPFVRDDPRWEIPPSFEDKAHAQAWVEEGSKSRASRDDARHGLDGGSKVRASRRSRG